MPRLPQTTDAPRRTLRRLGPRAKQHRMDGLMAAEAEARRLASVGERVNIAHLAREFSVPDQTLRDRINCTHAAPSGAHTEQMLLLPAEEDTLARWAVFMGYMGVPFGRTEIYRHVKETKGREPGKNWYSAFLKCNPMLRTSRSGGLDPKRAQNFNRTSTQQHFDELRAIIESLHLTVHDIYNMDEKGIQLGGGRKPGSTKFLFHRDDRSKYRIQSDDLELVTIIEATCADGTDPIKPGFVTQRGDIGAWWNSERAEQIG